MGAQSSHEEPPTMQDMCVPSKVNWRPINVRRRELATCPDEEIRLVEMLIAKPRLAHDIPTAGASISIVANAYGIEVDPGDIETRIDHPASIYDSAVCVGMKVYPIKVLRDHIAYHLHLEMPVLACIRVPLVWYMAGDDDRPCLGMDSYSPDAGRFKTILISCVICGYSPTSEVFDVMFDKNNSTILTQVNAFVIEQFARDTSLLDTATRSAHASFKRIKIKTRDHDTAIKEDAVASEDARSIAKQTFY